METKQDMYSAIESDDKFSILLRILQATGLDNEMRRNRKAITLLAPVNNAFLELPEKVYKVLYTQEGKFLAAAMLEQLLIPEVGLNADHLNKVKSIITIVGNELEISRRDDQIYIIESQVLFPEIKTSNGVILAIDKLLPILRKAVINSRGKGN